MSLTLFAVNCKGDLEPIANIDEQACPLNSTPPCNCQTDLAECDDGSQCVSSEVNPLAACMPDCESSLCDAYCEMELRCIPECMGKPCANHEMVAECAATCDEWSDNLKSQSTGCDAAITQWVGCITQSTCTVVEAFFHAHPDGVTDETPCAVEFRAINESCMDFEPRAEYSWDSNEDAGVPATPSAMVTDSYSFL